MASAAEASDGPTSPRGREGRGASKRDDAKAASVKIALQGYMLRKCRRAGDRKPFKRRFLILQGGSLYYFHAHSMAGQPRLLTHLPTGTTVTADPFTPDGRYPHALVIRTPDGREAQLSAADATEQVRWLQALQAGVGQPQRNMHDGDSDGGQTSLAFRLRLSVTGALASSIIGRKVVKHYLDAASRSLIDGLLLFATARIGASESAALECTIFDMAAKIATIFRANKLPVDFDWARLYDETNNFCRDFLVYSRDQRLKEKRGAGAEMQPLDMPELTRAGAEVALGWRVILEPHASPQAMERFGRLTDFFLGPDALTAILTAPAHTAHLLQVDAALRTLLETF